MDIQVDNQDNQDHQDHQDPFEQGKWNVLYLFVDSNDTELKQKYVEKIADHNQKVTTSLYADSGFDLFTPFECTANQDSVVTSKTYRIPLNVRCAMVCAKDRKPCGYYLYPRSSIIKTPFRIANSVGIIDAGYRGEIIAAVDNLQSGELSWSDAMIKYAAPYTRLFQICAPDLKPFLVRCVPVEDDLGKTARGSGGFGSTGA